MLDGESLRNKLIVNVLSASGIRIGGLVGLRLEHISNVDFGCKKIIVYAGTKEEYITFANEECSKVLDAYIAKRKGDGENVNGSSPLLRTDYRVGIEPVKMMSLNAIGLVLFRMACKVRGKSKGKYVRYSNAQGHSYRTRFITLCKQAENANVSLIEKLAGHQGAVKLDGSYFNPDENKLLKEYVKHADTLMISDRNRDKMKITELEARDRTISELKNDIKNLYLMMKKG